MKNLYSIVLLFSASLALACPTPPPTPKPTPTPKPAPILTVNSKSNSTSKSNSSSKSNSTATTGASTSNATTGPSSANSVTGPSTSSATTGDQSATTGDQSVTSDSGNRDAMLFIPSVVPVTPPSTLAVGNIVQVTSACGPLQRIVQNPISGTFFGVVKKSQIIQGNTDTLAPYLDEKGLPQYYNDVPLNDGRKGYTRFGHQVTQYTTIVGLSGVRNVAAGAGGGSSWGQVGGGSSASIQQIVTTIQLQICEVGTFVQPAPVVTHTLTQGPITVPDVTIMVVDENYTKKLTHKKVSPQSSTVKKPTNCVK